MEHEKGGGWHSRRILAELGRDFEGEIGGKSRSFSNWEMGLGGREAK